MSPASVTQQSRLILASASPRRREILGQLGLRFEVLPSGAPEDGPGGRDAVSYARGLAELKASSVAVGLAPGGYVLGADTVVVIDDRVLEKPTDDSEAVKMLMLLSGRIHRVVTAVSVLPAGQGGAAAARTVDVASRVRFRELSRDMAVRYVASGEGRDKAGSYAIQGLGAGLVVAIDGSYSNVVGLPACETLELLMQVGALECWP
ncbi:MAG: Maf family protein [Myxococcales bacterium]|nr:Maf family protein [Myxococcales bacterium]